MKVVAYRRRMAKLGFKVSLWTGEIVMAANNSANVQFAATLAVNAARVKQFGCRYS